MGYLTGSKHWDAANELLVTFHNQARQLESAGLYFMAAVALGAALETALLAFMFAEWDENAGEPTLPDRLTLDDLISAAKQIDVLAATKYESGGVYHSVEKVIHEIQWMRNNLHAARALRTGFNPAAFDKTQYQRLRDIYSAVMDNLLRNI